MEGPRLRLSSDRGEMDVFGGNLVLLTGSYGTGVDYLDEKLVGIRSRYRILPELRLGAQFLWSERSDDGEETTYPIYRRNDVYDFSVELEPWPGYRLLQGELSLSHYQKREKNNGQDKGWDYAVILGPYIRNSKLYLEANFRHIGSNYQPISRYYYSDQEGFFLSGQYWPWWFLSVFGSGDFYRNNLQDDPDLAAIDTKNAILGLQLGGTSLPLLTVRYGFTERKSRHDEPSKTDNRLQSYTGEITYSYRGWFPILRYQHYDYRDSATRASEYNSDLCYLELRKTFGNGSYSWISGDWNRYWSRSADSVTNTYTVRLGTDYRPSSTLDLRGELTYSRSKDDLHLIDTERKGLLASVNAYLPWNLSLYAEYGYAKVDEKAGGRDRDEHRLYLRLSQRFGWGERPVTAKPVVSGQPPPGYGTILGVAFDDRNGNGIQDKGEPLLSGIRLKLEDGSLATTDEEGKFSFLNVEMGEHTVALDTKKVPIEYDFVGEPKRVLEVKRRGTSQTDFAFLLLGRMAGRVIEDANGNGKSEEGEKGLANVLVVATLGEKTFLTYTDEDGNFQIENLRGGSYRLGLDLASLPEGGRSPRRRRWRRPCRWEGR